MKPEDVLLITKDPIKTAVLKIIYSGLSVKDKHAQKLHTESCTPYCVAPQVLPRKYEGRSDV